MGTGMEVGMSQVDLIREELLANRGSFVAMPKLAAIANCYAVHSRIADLRAEGLEVENRVEVCPETGTRKSYYRIPDPGQMDLFQK